MVLAELLGCRVDIDAMAGFFNAACRTHFPTAGTGLVLQLSAPERLSEMCFRTS